MTPSAKAPIGMWVGSFASGTKSRRKSFAGRLIKVGAYWGFLVCAALSTPQASRCQSTSIVTTAKMAVEPNHEMVGVPCQINGSKHWYTCVIDSGATYTIVSDRVVKAEGPTITMTTGNGVVRVHQREVSLTIADGLQLKSKALVQRKMIEGVDILVGQDVLRQFKYVTFDYENRQVEFQR
jgi:hypothetical protein